MSLKRTYLFASIVVYALLCGFNSSYAQTNTKAMALPGNQNWSFVQNIGQLYDENHQAAPDVKYYSHASGPGIFCRQGMVSFVFSKTVDANGQEVDLYHPAIAVQALDHRRWVEGQIASGNLRTVVSRADLVLLHANPNAELAAEDEQAYYENFYNSHTPEFGPHTAHTYQTVVYKNIYPNIDMLLHAEPGVMEYKFVIHPGGNAGDIKMQWNGLQNMQMEPSGGMHYVGEMIDITDSRPSSYISDLTANGIYVASNFVKNENVMSFQVSAYDHNQSLTIDPTITWGTYMGGGNRDYGQAVWTDFSNNVIMCGPCTAGVTAIATSSAYQSTYAGSAVSNAFLAKFSSAGTLQWCTYYGGDGPQGSNTAAAVYNDGWGLSTDNQNDIFMTGATSSTSGIATSGSFQSAYAGSAGGSSYNGYIAKFRPNGTRVWATYYGSNANDQSLFLATDASANVFMTAWVSSTSGLATSGAYQTSYGGGVYDAGLAKYDSSGKQIWSTYFGGSGYDVGNTVATDPNGNVLLCGQASSTSGIASGGAYQTSYGGGTYDAFIASFSPKGALNWSSYVGGSGYDIGWGVVCDQNGYVYINGQTSSSSGMASAVPYQSKNKGSYNSFLTKFTPGGNMVWSTFYGGTGTDIGYNLGTDPTGSIFVTGATTSKTGIATSGAYLSSLAGSQNAFLAKFSPAGNLMYGTYFGGSGTDIAWDTHADNNGNTYITGQTTSSSGIATSGSYQSAYATASENAFLAGLNFHVYGVDAGIPTLSFAFLFLHWQQDGLGQSREFRGKKPDLGENWLVGKQQDAIYGNWTGSLIKNVTTSVSLGSYSFSLGVDTIKVWTFSPNGVTDSMTSNDTLITTDSVKAYPKANAGGNHYVCSGSSQTLGVTAVSGYSYSWTSMPSGFTSTSATPTVSPTAQTTYYLTVTNISGGCTAMDSAIISVAAVPTPNAGGSHAVCYGGNYTLGGKAVAGHSYTWSSVPTGFSSSVSDPTVNPTVQTTYYETEVDTVSGCFAYSTATLTVNPEAKSNAGGNHAVCPGTSVALGATSVSGHTYTWKSNPTGYANSTANPTVTPTVSTTYYLTDVITSTGCTAGDSAFISLDKAPAPNAGGAKTACAGANVLIGEKAVTGDTYSWLSKPAGYTNTTNNPTVNPTVTTTYVLTETITATGCSKKDSAVVTVNPLPAAFTGGAQAICLGSTASIGGSSINGHSYAWSSKPKGFTDNISDPAVTPNVTTTYYLTETNTATGCSKKDSAVITVNFTTAYAGGNKTICLGSNDTLGTKAVTGNSYYWYASPGSFTSTASNPVVSPTTTTKYYLVEQNNTTNCVDTALAVVEVNPLPDAVVGKNQTACAGTPVTIGDTSSAPDSFSWVSNPVGFASNASDPMVNPTVTTTYTLTETILATGCAKSNTVKVTALPLPDAHWTAVSYSGKNTILHADDSSYNYNAYLWDFGDGDTASSHLGKHIYAKNKAYKATLAVTNTLGCRNLFDSTFTVAVSDIDEQLEAQGFSFGIYPNPFSTSSTVQYSLGEGGRVKISLLDITGKVIGVIADENQAPGNYSFEVNAAQYQLSPGMYMVQFVKDNQFVTKRLVKM